MVFTSEKNEDQWINPNLLAPKRGREAPKLNVRSTEAGGARVEVARSTRQQHSLTLGGSFAAYHGIAVTLALPKKVNF